MSEYYSEGEMMATDAVVIPQEDLQPLIDRLAGKEDPTIFRNLVKQVTGLNISTVQAANFLDIFGLQYETAIIKAKRVFIEKHFK